MILLYHRVVSQLTDPQLLDVAPERFEAQLRHLRENREVLSLPEFSERWLQGRLSPRAIAISFDDGYEDNLTNAAPILASLGLSATIFVATGFTGAQREAWWDALEKIVLLPPSLPNSLTLEHPRGVLHFKVDNDLGQTGLAWNLQQPPETARQRLYIALAQLLSTSTHAEQQVLLGRLYAWAGVSATPRPGRRFMDQTQLRACAKLSGITLGAHTVNHERLALLPPEAQQEEISGSKRNLEAACGCPVTLFSYPYGTYTDYGPAALAAVGKAGFRFAYANMPDRCRRLGSRHELPRLLVRDWDLPTFRQRLGLD